MKKEIIEKEPLDYTAIVYCDGSTGPSFFSDIKYRD